jgi:hypothetical protein
MQRIHDKIAECDREAALRGFSDTGFPRLWFAALSRVAGLDLQEPRRKARHPADGSIPSPVTRDTSPGICELQQQNDELRAEIARLREERRWVSVGERLPEDEEWVDVSGKWGDFIGWHDGEQWTNCDEDQLPNVTHWRKRTPGPEGEA